MRGGGYGSVDIMGAGSVDWREGLVWVKKWVMVDIERYQWYK